MEDRIDKRDFQAKMHGSIIKFWNVSYNTQKSEVNTEKETPKKEQLPSADYGKNRDMKGDALAIYERLQAEAIGEMQKQHEIDSLLAANSVSDEMVEGLLAEQDEDASGEASPEESESPEATEDYAGETAADEPPAEE